MIHSFFRENAEKFMSVSGKRSMIEELCHHIKRLENANCVLEAMQEFIFRFMGLDRNRLVQLYRDHVISNSAPNADPGAERSGSTDHDAMRFVAGGSRGR